MFLRVRSTSFCIILVVCRHWQGENEKPGFSLGTFKPYLLWWFLSWAQNISSKVTRSSGPPYWYSSNFPRWKFYISVKELKWRRTWEWSFSLAPSGNEFKTDIFQIMYHHELRSSKWRLKVTQTMFGGKKLIAY